MNWREKRNHLKTINEDLKKKVRNMKSLEENNKISKENEALKRKNQRNGRNYI